MRSSLLFLLMMTSVCGSAFAQTKTDSTKKREPVMTIDTAKRNGFFHAKKFESGAYFGTAMYVGQLLKTKAGMHLGFELVWVVNHSITVGAQYLSLTTRPNISPYLNRLDTLRLSHQMVGGSVGYIAFARKRFSLHPEVAGGWSVTRYNLHGKLYDNGGYVMPSVKGLFNAHKFFRIGAGLQYMAVFGANVKGFQRNTLSGFGGQIFLRVGTF